jgi:polyphenol oxidase
MNPARSPAPLAGTTPLLLDEQTSPVVLRFPLLESVPGFRHAVTTRLGGASLAPYGACNLGLSTGEARTTVLANRASVAALVAERGGQPATARQVHGVAAIRVEAAPRQGDEPLGEADMLATATPGVALLVQAADCAPIVLLDPLRHAAAVVHAGWRGTAAFAGREAVATMARWFGSCASDLVVGIGPAIGVCCYEVGDEVALAVDRSAGVSVSRPGPGGRLHTDITAALRAQFLAAGVAESRLVVAGLCTACRVDLFYSHRREGEPGGRFGALVALR